MNLYFLSINVFGSFSTISRLSFFINSINSWSIWCITCWKSEIIQSNGPEKFLRPNFDRTITYAHTAARDPYRLLFRNFRHGSRDFLHFRGGVSVWASRFYRAQSIFHRWRRDNPMQALCRTQNIFENSCRTRFSGYG